MSVLSKKHEFNEVFDSQALYRLLLNAISNPLRMVNIKEFADKLYGDSADFLSVALTILDNEVSFNTCENRQLSEEIISLTLSRRETTEKADYIFVDNRKELRTVIENAKCGTLADPHKSATVIVKIPDGKNQIKNENKNKKNLEDQSMIDNGKNLKPQNENVNLTFTGPGIDGNINICTNNIVEYALQIRDNRFFEYPEGIDFIFIDKKFNLFAIPRLIRKEVVA